MYLLDTDAISAMRRADCAPQVAAQLGGTPEAELFLSVITLGEIERGIRRQELRNPAFAADLRDWMNRTLRLFGDRLLPFGAEDAVIWGRLQHDLGYPGADLMIAATALRHDATVVTGKTDGFRPAGVALENPFEPR